MHTLCRPNWINTIGPHIHINPATRVSDVNSTFLQPFLSYTFPDTTTITVNSESTYNWITKEWTVPINLMVAHIFHFGSQPVQFQIGPRLYAVRPSGGPDWGARFNITLLFPDK